MDVPDIHARWPLIPVIALFYLVALLALVEIVRNYRAMKHDAVLAASSSGWEMRRWFHVLLFFANLGRAAALAAFLAAPGDLHLSALRYSRGGALAGRRRAGGRLRRWRRAARSSAEGWCAGGAGGCSRATCWAGYGGTAGAGACRPRRRTASLRSH